ncbi:7280_t:CDS:2 [Acaulospora morrowiae]|uniref:7280_t:CDS:1 n=1 Tax=Acaulospora morrowiae TaxID=94023 RepID=A0A9N8ZVZ5_9GLOM|nr:7280_t:CDS:2 [Acaulospora morrowiae]
MKPHLSSAKGSLDKRKSVWRKRFLTFLTDTLVDEEEQKTYDDKSKTRFEVATFLIQQGYGVSFPRVSFPSVTVVGCRSPRKLESYKHPPEATSFWENFELERQLTIKEIDALNVLDASRSQKSNEYIGKVNSRAESADTSSGKKRKKKSIPLEKAFFNYYFLYLQNKQSVDSAVLKKAKTISGDVEDDEPFINNNRAEGTIHSKATPSSLGSQSLEMSIGATEITSGTNDDNSFGCDIPRTSPLQIHSASENQDLNN